MKTAHGQLVAERFWSHVQKGGSPDDCWIWTGGLSTGYGTLYHSVRKRKVRAHQFSFELNVHPVPDRLDVVHTCNNRLCVNPRHLVLMTRGEMRRYKAQVLRLLSQNGTIKSP